MKRTDGMKGSVAVWAANSSFIECVEAVFDRISERPELHAVVYRTVRQTLVRRFPFVVCYVFEENRVDVLAVFHGQQDPAIWKLRVDLNDRA